MGGPPPSHDTDPSAGLPSVLPPPRERVGGSVRWARTRARTRLAASADAVTAGARPKAQAWAAGVGAGAGAGAGVGAVTGHEAAHRGPRGGRCSRQGPWCTCCLLPSQARRAPRTRPRTGRSASRTQRSDSDRVGRQRRALGRARLGGMTTRARARRTTERGSPSRGRRAGAPAAEARTPGANTGKKPTGAAHALLPT